MRIPGYDTLSAAVRKLAADDVFISYAHADGQPYSEGLVIALSAYGYSCLTDKYGSEAGATVPATLLRRMVQCKTLVLVGTDAAAKSEEVSKEVDEFASENGNERIIPIAFLKPDEPAAVLKGKVQKAFIPGTWPTAGWYRHVRGKPIEYDDFAALSQGTPSPDLVASIVRVSNYRKSKDRLAAYRKRAIATFALLLVVNLIAAGTAGWFGYQASRAKRTADREQAIADARLLANQAQTLLRRSPENILSSLSLAIDGATRGLATGRPVVESDSAVRDILSRIPHRMWHRWCDAGTLDIALSPDAKNFALLSEDGHVRVYRVNQTVPMKDFKTGATSGPLAISGEPSSVVVVDSGQMFEIYRFPTDTKQVIAKPAGMGVVRRLAVSPDGRYLAVIASATGDVQSHCNSDGVVVSIWDVLTAKKIIENPGLYWDNPLYYDVAFSGTGDLIIGETNGECATDGVIFMWALSDRLPKNRGLSTADFARSEHMLSPQPVSVVAWNSEASVLATERVLMRRDALATFRQVSVLQHGLNQEVAAEAFNGDGNGLVVIRRPLDGGQRRFSVEGWDVDDHRDDHHWYFADKPYFVRFTPDDAFIALATARTSPVVDLLNVTTANRRSISIPRAGDGEPAVFDGHFRVTLSSSEAFVFDIWTGCEVRAALSCPLTDVTAALTRDGSELAIEGILSGRRMAVVFRRGRTGYDRVGVIDIGQASQEPDAVSCQVDLAPQTGKLVVQDAGTVRIWDILTGADITPPPLRMAQLASQRSSSDVTISHDGKYVAISLAEIDRTPNYDENFTTRADIAHRLYVVDLIHGTVVHRSAWTKALSILEFSPDGRSLLAAGYDGVGVVMKLADSVEVVWRRKDDIVITAAAFTNDSRLLALGTQDGLVQLLDAAHPDTEVLRFEDDGRVHSIAFDNRGNRMATISKRISEYGVREQSYVVRLWQLGAEEVVRHARAILKQSAAERTPPSFLADSDRGKRVRK